MATLSRLENNYNALLEQYMANLYDVYDIQDTLLHSGLPLDIVDELGLGPDAHEWAKEWLSDTSSIFRICRRNKFTRSFCLEAIQKTLQWRLLHLWPPEPPTQIPNLHCLPSSIRDPFGRPIIILELTPVDQELQTRKDFILLAFERLRLHLRQLYDDSQDADPVLQYVILLDLSQLSVQSIDMDLFTWTVKNVIPRFPGMVAAVFMLNYSWTHAGLWNIFKRLLPETALSRVFFPSSQELIECFTSTALPEDFGGSLPALNFIDDPLHPESVRHPAHDPAEVQALSASPDIPADAQPQAVYNISSTSSLNPFFGYPVISTSPARGATSFRHGRQRKRDLLYTLAKLFWLRWKSHITASLCLVVLIVVTRASFRRRLITGVAAFRRGHPR